ncbi:MAG: pitrilysin family protein, partial [Pseudomonadota bacterium]
EPNYRIRPTEFNFLNIEKVTSESGIQAWLVEDHTAPILSIEFQFKGAGSSNDPHNLQGLSQMLSNTLDECAGEINAKDFQSILENKSIQLHFNSSRDHFGGRLQTLTKYQDDAYHLLALALTKPQLTTEAVERMKQANLSRIRSNMADPEWMQARLTNSILYKGHPYAKNSGGTLSGLSQITPELLRQKQQQELAKDNLLVSVAGNITPKELGVILDTIFGNLPAHAKIQPIADAIFPTTPDTTLLTKDIPQTFVTMILAGIDLNDPDYAAADVLNFILGSSGFGSRLTDVVREQRGLTYGIYSSLNHLDHSNILSITTSTKTESTQDVIDLTLGVMDSLIKSPVSEKELHDAKSYLIGSVPLELTSTSNIAGVIMGLQSAGLSADYLDSRIAAIQKITAHDVSRIAKRLLNTKEIQTIMVGTPHLRETRLRLVPTLPDVE